MDKASVSVRKPYFSYQTTDLSTKKAVFSNLKQIFQPSETFLVKFLTKTHKEGVRLFFPVLLLDKSNRLVKHSSLLFESPEAIYDKNLGITEKRSLIDM